MLAYLLSPKTKHNSMFVLALCSLCFYYDQTVKIHIKITKMLFPILNFQKINFVHHHILHILLYQFCAYQDRVCLYTFV